MQKMYLFRARTLMKYLEHFTGIKNKPSSKTAQNDIYGSSTILISRDPADKSIRKLLKDSSNHTLSCKVEDTIIIVVRIPT